jgi:peptidyl-prolyl cis-trans isomerase C
MMVSRPTTALVALVVFFVLAGGCASGSQSETQDSERESLTEADEQADQNRSANTSSEAADEANARGVKSAHTNDKASADDVGEVETELPVVAVGPVAVIDGKEIGPEAFNKMIRQRTQGQRSVPYRLAKLFKTRVMKQVIDDYLISRELDKEGIEVTDDEVQAEFETFTSRFPNERSLASFMERAGGEASIRADMRKSLRLEKLLGKLYRIDVSEQQARAHFNKNKERYQEPEQVRARHILIKTNDDSSEDDLAKAKKRAQEIANEAKSGADFAELAREHSEGPTSTRGGDLGFFPRKRMVPEFDKAAFSMKKGEVSDPVKTQFGYHVIKLVDRKPATEHKFEDVDEEIYKRLERENLREKLEEFILTLRDNAEIVEKPDNIVVQVEEPNDAAQ